MKNSLMFLIALMFGFSAQAADLSCAKEEKEIARCSLTSIQYGNAAPEGFPFPTEAVLCEDLRQSSNVDFLYRVGNENSVLTPFVKTQDHYISASPLENIEMHVDSLNKQIKLIEPINGQPMTFLFSCVLW